VKSLEEVLYFFNFRRELFKQEIFDIDNLSDDDKKQILDWIKGCLSPENISADGERSATEQKRLRIMYEKAAKQLGCDDIYNYWTNS